MERRMRPDFQVGDYVRYVLSEKRHTANRSIYVTTWTYAEVIRYDGNKVTVKLVSFPSLNARTVRRTSWRILW